METKINYMFAGKITHEDYRPLYFCFNDANGNGSLIDVDRRQIPNTFTFKLPVDFNSKSTAHLISIIYNEAITTHDLITSYLLMWQIFEVIEAETPVARVIEDDDIHAVECLLLERGLPQHVVRNRVSNALRAIRGSSQPERILDGLARLAPTFTPRPNVATVLRNARAMRGRLVHPIQRPNVYSKELHANYVAIRDIVSSFVQELR
ncbi:MAG: hypothetical protein U1F76_28130 [Candidatus Competibacteraceae bacterium]